MLALSSTTHDWLNSQCWQTIARTTIEAQKLSEGINAIKRRHNNIAAQMCKLMQ